MPKTNCGVAIEVPCTTCYDGYKLWCSKCTIIELRKKISILESENSFLKKEYDTQFDIKPFLIHKYILQHLEPQKYDLSDNTFFYTITFDPSRFKNLGTNSHQEEQYILHQLSYMIKDGYIFKMYGCFELTKDGITHAHININTYQPIELKQKLKERFTFNMRNKYAIDCGKANLKSIDYINKIEDGKGTENKTWFTCNQDLNPNSKSFLLNNFIDEETVKQNPCPAPKINLNLN